MQRNAPRKQQAGERLILERTAEWIEWFCIINYEYSTCVRIKSFVSGLEEAKISDIRASHLAHVNLLSTKTYMYVRCVMLIILFIFRNSVAMLCNKTVINNETLV